MATGLVGTSRSGLSGSSRDWSRTTADDAGRRGGQGTVEDGDFRRLVW